jgi:hypothetical protein
MVNALITIPWVNPALGNSAHGMMIMTSISSGVSYTPQSPTSRLQSFLQTEVSAGVVPSADADALSSAISDIGNALQGSQSTSSSTTQAASPTSMKDKIDNAIDQEVKDGKLTQDQATELKKVFADAQQQMGKMGRAGGHHHHAESSTDSDADATTTATTTDGSSSSTSTSASDPLTLLANFLKTLETAAKGNAVYNSSAGQSSGLQSVLLNAIA